MKVLRKCKGWQMTAKKHKRRLARVKEKRADMKIIKIGRAKVRRDLN